ncbi:MAG: 3-dehydroquinate synthase [Planctomycetes bacterium]|nr:3-dehydroquinate synthase [Planctomycetota bacterium]MCB9919239.1 3-dehydroquinate synthase [Planctomycetota bacterium]
MIHSFTVHTSDDRSMETVVAFGRGLRHRLPDTEALPGKRRLYVIDRNVHEAWQEDFRLGDANVFVIPPGERAKSAETLLAICSDLARRSFERTDALVSIGGGACGDVTGLAASLFLRGIAVAHVPTTIVSMVDAALGGKCAIDIAEGKNLIGSFWTPSRLIIDPDLLRTLPSNEVRAGFGEVAKYAIGFDAELEPLIHSTRAQAPEGLDAVILRCLQIKADIVAHDLRESDRGKRILLNLGHTTAHAIEAWALARDIIVGHGEAVAFGIRCAIAISLERGLIASREASRCVALLDLIGAAKSLAELVGPHEAPTTRDLAPYLAADKKVRSGRLRAVLPIAFGACEVHDATIDEFLEAISSLSRS